MPNPKISERGIVAHLVYFDTSKLGKAGPFEPLGLRIRLPYAYYARLSIVDVVVKLFLGLTATVKRIRLREMHASGCGLEG